MSKETYAETLEKIPQLMQHSNLSFLIGAGCSHPAGLPLMGELTIEVCNRLALLEKIEDDETIDEINRARQLLFDISNSYPEGSTRNIEVYLSEIQDVNSILSRHETSGVESPYYTSRNGNQYSLADTERILAEIKSNIVDILSKGVTDISAHRKFIQAIHGRLRSGRERSSTPISYFILNYDTIIEDVLALEGIVFSDGFVGGVSAWWDPSCYDKSGSSDQNLQAKVIKLHGSIDWIPPESGAFPIRVRSALIPIVQASTVEPAMIYPASVKYREAQNDPYALLIQRFRATLSSGSDHVLCVMGYSFGDEHINFEIEHALRENNALSLIAFLGGNNPPSSVSKWLSDSEICDQVQTFGKKAVIRGSETILTVHGVPSVEGDFSWYKFEELASILSGIGD